MKSRFKLRHIDRTLHCNDGSTHRVGIYALILVITVFRLRIAKLPHIASPREESGRQ